MHHVRQPVLETVAGTGNRLRNLPQHQLGKRCFRVRNSGADKLNSLHVGDDTNMYLCCQQLQRSRTDTWGRTPTAPMGYGKRGQGQPRWRHSNGFSAFKPAFLKSRVFRVAIVRSCWSAVAAIIPSSRGIVSPFCFKSTTSLAQRRLIVASHGRHSMVCMSASNHCSSYLRLRPRGSARMPIHSSPRMMESTTRFLWLALNQSMPLLLGAGFVGSLSTFASTR